MEWTITERKYYLGRLFKNIHEMMNVVHLVLLGSDFVSREEVEDR